MNGTPLSGIRVLSMEQAVALPFATRHLADMGAEIIRVQSHKRLSTGLGDIDLTRNKRQLAIDLASPGGPDVFLRVAEHCDIVAHNYTPRVVRQFGIDYEHVRAVRPDVIYVSLTGFGTTGPWGERPLFGPGAEAVSGHNALIGEPDAWPGRPGTVVYADSTCGLYATFAILAALDERDRTGRGQHIDVSLYETAVSHLGAAIAERQLGANPRRFGNADTSWAIHGVFDCLGTDRHLALALRDDQRMALAETLHLEEVTVTTVTAAVRTRDAVTTALLLQSQGIAATVVADASDTAGDEHLWTRRYFDLVERKLPGWEGTYPHSGPAWGHGSGVRLEEARAVGADTAAILGDVAGYSATEIEELFACGAIGTTPPRSAPHRAGDNAVRVHRGELSRVDPQYGGWRRAAASAEDRR